MHIWITVNFKVMIYIVSCYNLNGDLFLGSKNFFFFKHFKANKPNTNFWFCFLYFSIYHYYHFFYYILLILSICCWSFILHLINFLIEFVNFVQYYVVLLCVQSLGIFQVLWNPFCKWIYSLFLKICTTFLPSSCHIHLRIQSCSIFYPIDVWITQFLSGHWFPLKN